jgi:catechol 2,3-dioxygenase-like lactoylglutathione lyase family enzyme
MIDHTGVSVTDVAKAKAFYRAALAPLGYGMLMEWELFAGFGVAPKPDFWIGQGIANEPRVHVVPSRHARTGRCVLSRGKWPADATTARQPAAHYHVWRLLSSIRTATISRRSAIHRRDRQFIRALQCRRVSQFAS